MNKARLVAKLLIPLLPVAFACSCSQNPPEGVFAAPSLIDFGTVVDTKQITQQFAISNTSDSVVNVIEVKGGCGCTQVSLSNHTIQPHSTIHADIDIDLTGKHGKEIFEVIVYTDSRISPMLQVRLVGNVAVTGSLADRLVSLGNFPPGAQVEQEIVLSRRGNQDAEIVAIESVSGVLGVDNVTAASGRKDHFVLRVFGKAPDTPGEFSGTFRVTWEHADWRDRTFIASGLVTRCWQIPHQIYCGFTRAGQPLRKVVVIESTPGLNPRDLSSVISARAIVDNKDFEAAATISESGAVEVLIELANYDRVGPREATLEVEVATDDGRVEQLSASLFARVLADPESCDAAPTVTPRRHAAIRVRAARSG